MRLVASVAAIAFCVWLLGRLTPASPPAALRVVDSVSIATLDPAQISWLQDIRVVLQLYEGLYKPNPTGGGVVPGCGDAAEVVDRFPNSNAPRTYRFRIRSDARWSNGDSLTAFDFLFAWRRALEPGTARDYAFFFDHIRGVREYVAWRHAEIERIGRLPAEQRPAAVTAHLARADQRFMQRVGIQCEDSITLRVELAHPVAYWLDLLAFPVFLPLHRESVEPFGRAGLTGQLLDEPGWSKPGRTYYNGPYRLADWRFKRGLRLEKNSFYHDADRVHVPSIEWLDVADANTAWLMYEAGRVDCLLSLEARFAPELVARSSSPLAGAVNHAGRSRHDIHAVPALGTYFYNFNCMARLPDGTPNPFADVRVRRAFARAVDRRALCADVTRRGEAPATALVPPDMLPDYPHVDGPDFDVTAARNDLAEAGWPDGRGLPEIQLLFNNEAEHPLIAQSIAASLERNLNVRVRLIGKEAQTYREDKRRHEFMMARASWYGDYEDPTTFLDVFRSDNGNNDSGYADAEYDRLLERAEAIADPQRRLAALADCERHLANGGVPMMPLFHYVNVYAYDPRRLTGLSLNSRLLVMFQTVRVRR